MKKQIKPIQKIENKTELLTAQPEKKSIKVVKKSLPVKRAVSTRSAVVDLKNSPSSRKKEMSAIRPGKKIVAKVMTSEKRFNLPLMQEELVIREVEDTVVHENYHRRKMFFLFFVIVMFAVLFALVFKKKYIGSQSVECPALNSVAVSGGDPVVMVSKLMVLPQNEAPTIVTIVDGDGFSGKHIFSNAETQDKVLIYAQANMAILYRPSVNKVIETVPLTQSKELKNIETVSNSSASANRTATTALQSEVSVVVYNGSKTKGLAATLANKLTEIKGVTVIKKTNAVGNFEKTLVIDLTGKNVDAINIIAQAVSGQVAQLPAGEVAPKADILVIGADSTMAKSL